MALSAVGTVASTRRPPSSKQLQGPEGRRSSGSPRGRLPSAASLLFTQRQAAEAAPPATLSNPGSFTVDSLSQRITSGHCIPKELPTEPSPGPPPGPLPAILTGWCQVGLSVLPIWGTYDSCWGPGLEKCHFLPLPPVTEGRVPPEYPGEWSLSHSLSVFPHLDKKTLHSSLP